MSHQSAFTKIREYSNDDLRALLKEHREIGKYDAPAKIKRSPKMEELYKLETHDYNYWSDRHHNIGLAVQFEIMDRIRNDKF